VKQRGSLALLTGSLALGWAGVYADRTVLYPMLRVIGKDFQLTATTVGLASGLYFLLYVAMQIPSGIIGDRFGLRPVLVTMYFASALGMLIVGLLATNFTVLLVGVAVVGAGAGVYYTIAYAIALHAVPNDQRGKVSGVINSGMSFGLILGMGIAGPLYSFSHSWRVPFVVLGLPTLAIPFIFLRAIPVDTQERSRLASVPWRLLLTDRDLMSLNLASFASLYGFWVVITWGPTFLQSERGFHVSASGFYVAAVALAALPAGLVTGRLSDRWGRKRLSFILIPLATLSLIAVASVKSDVLLLLALAMYGMTGKLAWDPVAIAWFGDCAAQKYRQSIGAAMGIYSVAGMSSAIFAPLISGALRDATGSFAPALYLGAAVVASGFIFCAICRERRLQNATAPTVAREAVG
jgi:MFS family permease